MLVFLFGNLLFKHGQAIEETRLFDVKSGNQRFSFQLIQKVNRKRFKNFDFVNFLSSFWVKWTFFAEDRSDNHHKATTKALASSNMLIIPTGLKI